MPIKVIGSHQPLIKKFLSGALQKDIADEFGVTAQRISQILDQNGLKGHARKRSKKLRKEQHSEYLLDRDKRYLESKGAVYEEYLKIRDSVGRPTRAYIEQKRNAHKRGISWNFTLSSWWKVWEESGLWHLRGRAKGLYCMSRFNDEGPYEPGNVFIQEFGENSRQGRTITQTADRRIAGKA